MQHSVTTTNNPKRTISLVLGSGGARGIAHIGVIHWLEENGFVIKSISGCSMGALVGGVYAAGKLKEFERWIVGIGRREMVSLMDIAWGSGGLIKGEKLMKHLISLIADRQIQDLPIKFTAVAADIHGEKEVWINTGSLFTAIRASISLPLIFTPVKYHGSYVIDGGVLNPVPIAPTFSDHTDLTIAVNLGGTASHELESTELKPKEVSIEAAPEEVTINPKQEEEGFFERFLKKSESEPGPKSEGELGLIDIANLSFDSMQSTIARQKLAAYPPDEIIEIPKSVCGMLDFDRSKEMVKLGYETAERSLKHLLEK